MFNFLKMTQDALKRTREGFLGKVSQVFDRPGIEDSLWDDLEELLISADVGMATTDKLITRMKERAKAEKMRDPTQLRGALKLEMVSMLKKSELAPGDGMNLVMVVGVNGSGKTTSIAKLANYLKGRTSVLLAAGDTFRAAAIDQLQLWGNRIGVDVIANKPGGDPAAVVFDAAQAALSRHISTVIVDTAGRLHTKFNLMEELKKIRRVAAKAGPSRIETVLVLDATTGQNGLLQARHFKEAVEVTGVFLTKLDGTAKGGIVLAISDELGLPIMFIGTGESIDDIAPFDPEAFVNALFGD
ncbi:MAG: signal recognition particle-docking protein FtsY [Chloroflexi bacterium]|nr:signal recognition particle-docking protein FtsY [Chloroflexota bacterium]